MVLRPWYKYLRFQSHVSFHTKTHSEEEDEEDDDADDELRKEDMCKVVFVSKSDLHGLGYRGMNIPEETMKKKKRIVRGEVFFLFFPL